MGDRGTNATSLSGLTPIYVRGLFCALRGACRDVVQLEEGGGHVPLLVHTRITCKAGIEEASIVCRH